MFWFQAWDSQIVLYCHTLSSGWHLSKTRDPKGTYDLQSKSNTLKVGSGNVRLTNNVEINPLNTSLHRFKSIGNLLCMYVSKHQEIPASNAACEGCLWRVYLWRSRFVTGMFGLPTQKSILNVCHFQPTREFAALKHQVAFEQYLYSRRRQCLLRCC